MYRLGTGDFLTLKFTCEKKDSFATETEQSLQAENPNQENINVTADVDTSDRRSTTKQEDPFFRVLIDCGVCTGSKDDFIKHFEEFQKDFSSNEQGNVKIKIDLLIVTHEHQDHVLGFEMFEELFSKQADIGEIWFAWTENDKASKIKSWKTKYGEKLKKLGFTTEHLNSLISQPDFNEDNKGYKYENQISEGRTHFANVLSSFTDLHLSKTSTGSYKGGLEGMNIIKSIQPRYYKRFLRPGDVIKDFDSFNIDGLKVYVLGPPTTIAAIKQENGGPGESYKHNKELDEFKGFNDAIGNMMMADSDSNPFSSNYVDFTNTMHEPYNKEPYRKIDNDWLQTAGRMALRMNSLTNNLSLALAFEIDPSKKILLFPGDAEFGSWQSWHEINWSESTENKNGGSKQITTKDILNRTVFYKVAHHLSHNGTPKSIGVDYLNNEELACFATLDYSRINSVWRNTMPNRHLTSDLLANSKGRFLLINDSNIYLDKNKEYTIREKIKESQIRLSRSERINFYNSIKSTELYHQYTVYF